jgi:hypothetical protein
MNIPTVGAIEVPMRCSAQSDGWLFQASFWKDLTKKWIVGVPHIYVRSHSYWSRWVTAAQVVEKNWTR